MDEIDAHIDIEDSEDSTLMKSSQNILLFYHFHPLSKEREVVELYRSALEKLCQSLGLQGRILVGCNEHQSEGINGTLSGSQWATKAFVYALTRQEDEPNATNSEQARNAIQTFWRECEIFYQLADCKALVMDPSEFKWSTCNESKLFPDLNIKIVKELIGTGGVLAPISLTDVHQGYLTPTEWHDRISQLQNDEESKQDTVLIDCRNTKEWQIGHFPGAPDPSTTTFNQFPTWVQQNAQTLANKKVLMYCTGGIRCEKASAFIRKEIPSVKEVRHLKGGIHKYLDQFGSSDDCMWKGKNFVFDGRGAHGAQTLDDNTNGSVTKKEQVVGTCLYCPTPYDVFEPGCVCTVCRELTLVCPKCRQNLHEYHCHLHAHLRHCYFTDLKPFTRSDLESQLNELKALIVDIAVGKKYKHKRKTLTKQCDKINHRLVELENIGTTDIEMQLEMERKCRNCGQPGCSGNCWGCHGLKRKRILEEMHKNINDSGSVDGVTSNSVPAKGVPLNKSHNAAKEGNNGHLQKRKALERQNVIDELIQLKLASSPSEGRNKTTGIRIPTSCTRTLQTNTKGKWCGKSLLSVLQTEFAELAQTGILCTILQRGLLRVNDKTINGLEEATALKLKNMDVIVRVNHWHEPPVHIPSAKIDLQKVILPRAVQDEYNIENDSSIFVCDKPSTVPVHPAGPYLSNSLTMMVEAQEGMIPKTLIPCHRIDRVTSGLTLCCTNPKVARLVQSRIDGGFVKKQYLAKVHGKFPNQTSDMKIKATEIATWSWSIPDQMLEVNAPIETVDPSNGIRMITSKGKAARSLFRLIGHDEVTNTSMVLCSPLTGRSHQLRVHLQWLGHSIVNDIQYGGMVDTTLDVGAGLAESKQRRQQELEGGNIISLHSSSISEADAKAAMDICTFCTQGPEKAFTPAQLLQGGHLICLHAWRYKIPFVGKKSGNAVDSSVPLAELDLQVGMPSWAFGTDSLLSILSG